MGIAEQIAQAELRVKQLKALKQKQSAREKALAAKKERANDTRRKILLGAFYLDQMQKNESFKAQIVPKLDAYLTRNDDRALFDLPPTADHGNNAI